MEDFYETFATAEIFRLTRTLNNYSQEEMAQMLNIPRSTLTLIEGRKRVISAEVLLQYLDTFNITQTDFDETQANVTKLLKENSIDWLEITHIVLHMLISAKKAKETPYE